MATLKEMEAALRAADAAGNVEDARKLADAIVEARGSQADFGNVAGGTRSTEQATQPNFGKVQGRSFSTESPASNASLFRADSDFRKKAGLGVGDMMWAAGKDMFGTRQGAAEYLAGKAGGSVASENGSPVVVLRDGTRYRTNDPGIDNADAANLSGNITALLTPASWAARLGQARNFNLAGRTLMQGGTAASAETGLMSLFNDGKVDPVRVGIAGVGGGGGELAGTALSGLLGRMTSSVRSGPAEASSFLRQQGVQPVPEVVDRVRGNLAQVRAGADPRAIAGQAQYGFEYTLGQRLMDQGRKFQQLSKEEVLRQTPGGFAAFDGVARNNATRLDDTLTGLGERFGGNATRTPAELVSGAGAGLVRQADDLRTRIGTAYDAAGRGARTAVGSEAVGALPGRLRQALREFDIHPSTTPATARALDLLQEATTATLGSNVKGVTLRAIETQRRILNNSALSAANPTDRAAMQAVRREFDGWLDDAVETALVRGDKGALDALRDARALRAEFGRRFEGGGDTDRFIAGLLDGSRTPEELLNIALGASQVSKASGARFIDRLRLASNNDPGVMGGLRAAHFARLTRGQDGRPLGMAQIVRNIRQTTQSNGSAVKALYGPEQWREVTQLASALEPMIARGDFAKSSGTAERMARMLFSKMGGGLLGDTVKAATSGLKGVQAQRAIHAPVRMRAQAPPGFVPVFGETLGEYGKR